MNCTKDELKEAIMMVAKAIGHEKSYEFYIMMKPMSEIVEKMAYDMFVAEFGLHNCSGDLCDNYKLIFEFSKELESMGYVEFK